LDWAEYWRFWTGVVSILVVANLVWPRFVRHDFISLARAALLNVEKLVELQHRSLASGADLLDDARTTGIALREQSLKLRALLQNGANESLYFRRRLPSYTMAVVSLVHLLQASLDLFRRQKGRNRSIWMMSAQSSSRFTRRLNANCNCLAMHWN
jgi:hypothetical protein